MSSSSSPAVSTSHLDRPRSIRSVASNSSIASGVSLTRRSRTRTRSKTVTGSLATRPDALPQNPVLDLPFIDQNLPHEPDTTPQASDTLHPPHALNVATSSRSLTSQEADSAAGEVTLVTALPQQSPMPAKLSKAAKQAERLASIETSYNPALSAFSRDPELTPNARDSFSTQKSGTSSSFYPPSTSTVSGPTSPASPRTTAEEILQQPNISLLTEDVDEMQDYDGDDVAYRLRLLVNNNYFLPPAHMKPSPQDLGVSMTAKKPQKSSPTFLDIFRVGKSKSKPTTPVAPTFGAGPVLRTTSDSITASFALRTQSQPPHLSTHPTMMGNVDRGRVVVVRERMNSIAVAAKQAEQEMKTRNAKREQGSDKGKQPAQSPLAQAQDVGDVIDPTDVVDIPLPASNYPFAVQASALHGLGVQESVGAAVLADRLPPNSPNISIYDPDDWRKALLQEAVHHSLDNSPDESVFSHVPGTSTPILATPRVNGPLSRSTTPGTRAKKLQQRIADPQPSLEMEDVPAEEDTKKKDPAHQSQRSQASTTKSVGKFLATPESNDSRRSSYLPARAITPVGNLTPLSPAPRKRIFNAPYSISQTDLQDQHRSVDGEPAASISPKSKLRKSMSTPMLSEAYESMRQQFGMTPPPPPLPATRRSSQMTQLSMHTQSYETSREMPSRASAFSSHSHFDDLDDRIVRGSPRLSALGTRPSFSNYSQASLSPTTSAFQDALNHSGGRSTVSSIHRPSIDHPPEEAHARSSLASPPPRPSTSIAHIALRPPPRSSSLNYSGSGLGRSSTSSEPRIEVSVASPTKAEGYPAAPPHPPFSRHRDINPIPLSLRIPTTTETVAIHSPAPSSPTSFFDTLQTQPNAMDDLDSSDSEEDGDEEETDVVTQSPPPLPHPHSYPKSPPPFNLDPRARANSTMSLSPIKPSTMMRLGNFSTPYVGRGQTERSRTLPVGVVDTKKALGFTPTKGTFFSERKNDLGRGAELSTSLLVQAQERSIGSSIEANVSPHLTSALVGPSTSTEKRRPSTAGQVPPLPQTSLLLGPNRKPEALRKLDGMLVQHMEAEKDRIRKIAGALKSSSQVNLVGSAGGSGSGQP